MGMTWAWTMDLGPWAYLVSDVANSAGMTVTIPKGRVPGFAFPHQDMGCIIRPLIRVMPEQL